MKLIRKIFIYLLLISSFLFLITGITYTYLIYKPESIPSLANRFFDNKYIIEYQNIDSDGNFLSPGLSFEDIFIKDLNNKIILEADKIAFGINILSTYRKNYLDLNFLNIKNFSYSDESPSKSKTNFKAFIGMLDIQSDTFNLLANKTFIEIQNGNTSIVNNNGVLNNISFNELSIFNESGSDKIYYSSNFNLDEEIINNENFLNLESFSEYEINLVLQSKGYLDLNSGNLENINKYIFKESKLITLSQYPITKISMVMHSNINKNISGSFEASIPDQNIEGSILINNQIITIRSKLMFDMAEIINFEEYFKLEGSEEFNGILTINNKLVSLELDSSLSNTKITSIIDDLEKESIQELKTTIKIKDLSNPTYFIYNKNFKSYIGSKNNGYFSLGNQFDQQIESRNFEDGFYLFLSLQKLDISNISLNNEINGVSNLKSINLDVKELNFFENLYKNQKFEIDFENNNINAAFSGKDLNGMIVTDKTGFIKIEVFDTKFEFQGINIIESGGSNDLTDINLRFIGRNIKTYDDTFQDVDFYLLRNKRITTIDNIKIKSKNFNIGPTSKNEKAYISYNKTRDLYKVRGSYEINNKDNSLNNFTNYNLGYISTDLNIQWISLQELKDIQGNIKFLIKDFESKNSLPDSAFLRALKVFNLNAIIENISNETNIGNKNLVINRAEGDFYISQNRALINKPIKLQTSEANMRWIGEVLKNSDGILDKLNLDLEMRLRVSENIPWYAAIFGGVPALAGGIVLENIFEDSLDSVSTFNFKVKGTVEEPLIERLD
tara:strand:+ start:1003 stop:3354 length:2352 start_codon:yes stop_codon:yes gene_type:complete